MPEPEPAEETLASDLPTGGPGSLRSFAETRGGIDVTPGGGLRELADTFRLLQRTRLVLVQRGSPFAENLSRIEDAAGRALLKEFKRHIIYDWLPKGTRGAVMARLVAAIGDPRRFPGQACALGHISAPIFDIGGPCPWVGAHAEIGVSDDPGRDAEASIGIDLANGTCPGTMLAPRRGSGVRSLWHYLGLSVRDDHILRLVKGQKADFSTTLRALILMPDVGLRAQIVKHRTPVYRDTYDEAKDRLLARGLPRHRADKISGIIAVKQFLGDMLIEWKRRLEDSR